MEYLLIAIAALCAWVVIGSLYRLLWHPLAKFPGPRLAAITTLYEGYYDAILKGQYTFKIGELHRQYGPIVRVGPNEVHILDPEYYHVLYSGANRLDKSPYFYSMQGNPNVTFATIPADVHKMRRGTLAPYFSSQAVAKFYPYVQGISNRLIERMESAAMRNEPIPLSHAYRAMTVDIITEYMFGYQFKFLERADWGADFYWAWYALWELAPTVRQLPFILTMFESMPQWLTKLINPQAFEVVKMFSDIDVQTELTLKMSPAEIEKQGHANIVWELAHNDHLPPRERSFKRLSAEACNVTSAGFETTAANLVHATFKVLANPDIHKKLVEALEEAIPDPDYIPHYTVLEKIPYLFAVVKETLRLTVGAVSRLPRITKEPLNYKEWVIPKGAEIGMSAYYVHFNPSVFPNPEKFDPMRWISTTEPVVFDPNNDERNLLSFSKGPRGCVGINLAYAELYSVLATVFRRYGRRMELYNTSESDMEMAHDYFAGMVRRGCSMWVRIKEETQ